MDKRGNLEVEPKGKPLDRAIARILAAIDAASTGGLKGKKVEVSMSTEDPADSKPEKCAACEKGECTDPEHMSESDMEQFASEMDN